MELILERLQPAGIESDTVSKTAIQTNNTTTPTDIIESVRGTYINTGFELINRKSTR